MLSLHGLHNDIVQAEGLGFPFLGAAEDFITLVPDDSNNGNTYGDDGGWNVTPSPGSTQLSDIDFLLALIRQEEDTRAIDPARVYLTGISNGAAMSSYLAMLHPDVFAGVAALAGAIGATGRLLQRGLHQPGARGAGRPPRSRAAGRHRRRRRGPVHLAVAAARPGALQHRRAWLPDPDLVVEGIQRDSAGHLGPALPLGPAAAGQRHPHQVRLRHRHRRTESAARRRAAVLLQRAPVLPPRPESVCRRAVLELPQQVPPVCPAARLPNTTEREGKS